MVFRRMATHKSWVIGSLESDTGSEYLFGYDPQKGLMWLERSGVEYGPSDGVWKEAEHFISGDKDYSIDEPFVDAMVEIDASELRPKRVTRSVVEDYEMGFAQGSFDDYRVVGESGPGEDYGDDQIAAQAAMMLQELEDE